VLFQPAALARSFPIDTRCPRKPVHHLLGSALAFSQGYFFARNFGRISFGNAE